MTDKHNPLNISDDDFGKEGRFTYYDDPAREWWVMVDSCDGASLKIFDDKITALDNASGLRNVTVIRVREVIDGEDA